MLILFIIVYNRESVSVGKSAWFSRLLKSNFGHMEKYMIQEVGGGPGRARGRFANGPPANGKFSKFAARQQLWS